jgi:hypothetical protein
MDRRDLLKNGAAAVVGGAVGALSEPATLASQAPAVVRTGSAGRPFRAWVRSGTQIQIENLRTLPLGPRSVLIRSEATQCCYSMVGEVLAPTQQDVPKIIGHGGVGVHRKAAEIQGWQVAGQLWITRLGHHSAAQSERFQFGQHRLIERQHAQPAWQQAARLAVVAR